MKLLPRLLLVSLPCLAAPLRCACAEPSQASRAPAAAPANSRGNLILLDRSAPCAFTPLRAYFVVDFGSDRVYKLPAEVMIADEEGRAGKPGLWYFGVGLPIVEGIEVLQHALLVQGEAGNELFLPPRLLSLAGDNTFGASPDALREHLTERKKTLESWRVQLRVQEESLERLRADAEVIGNLGRVAERTEDLERTRAHLAGVQKDMQNLERFLRLASKGAEPKNFVRRRAELTTQLEELARAARDMEAGESSRKSTGEADLHRDVKLVEMTRDENYDALREELAGLRKRRIALEEKYMSSASRENDDYKPPQQ